METSSHQDIIKLQTNRHTHSGLKTETQGWWLTISRGGCVSPRADPTAHSAVDVLSINAKVTRTIRPLSFSQWTCVVANCRCASSHFNYTGCVPCNYSARVLITPALTCSCHWAICVCVTVCGLVCVSSQCRVETLYIISLKRLTFTHPEQNIVGFLRGQTLLHWWALNELSFCATFSHLRGQGNGFNAIYFSFQHLNCGKQKILQPLTSRLVIILSPC